MLNCAIIMGRLTSDPELRTTTSGLSVTSFTVAVDRNYKSGEERQTDFINCVAWRGTADFVSTYFKKGQMIAVQGSIQTRNYEDKNGNKRTAVEIVADNVSFCGSKNENNNGNTYNTATPTPTDAGFTVLPENSTDPFVPFGADDDEGLPFQWGVSMEKLFNYLIVYNAQKPLFQTLTGNMSLQRNKKIETFEDLNDVREFIKTELKCENVIILNFVELAPTFESGEDAE